MGDEVLSRSAAEVCQAFSLGEAAQPLLVEGQTAGQLLGALIDGDHHLDATRLLAHALPKREAVWWAALCVRDAVGTDRPPAVSAALEAAEAWVREPIEANRHAAMRAAEAAGLATPAGCVAASAFWSGGSLAPPDLPVVPPPDHLTAQGSCAAIMLAGLHAGPEKAPENYRTFLERGRLVADGTSRWEEPEPPAPPPGPGPRPSKGPESAERRPDPTTKPGRWKWE